MKKLLIALAFCLLPLSVAAQTSVIVGPGPIPPTWLRGQANTWTANQTISGAALLFSGNISGGGIFGTSGIKVQTTAGTLSDTTSTGTIADNRVNAWGANTLTASSATTLTNNYGNYFAAATCSTNVTCTNNWALGADSALINGNLNTGRIIETSATTNTFVGAICVGATTCASSAGYISRSNGITFGAFATGGIGFSSTSDPSGTPDAVFWRASTGVVELGNTSSAGTGGSLLLTNITPSGVIINTGITTDATHTTATVCEDTTSHQFYFGSGTVGICLGTSSARYKHDILPLEAGLAQIAALRPVSYKLNADHGDPNKVLYGFTAEQGGTVLPKLMGTDRSGKPNTFDYVGLVPVLVKAIQQQQAQIAKDNARIAALERRQSGK